MKTQPCQTQFTKAESIHLEHVAYDFYAAVISRRLGLPKQAIYEAACEHGNIAALIVQYLNKIPVEAAALTLHAMLADGDAVVIAVDDPQFSPHVEVLEAINSFSQVCNTARREGGLL